MSDTNFEPSIHQHKWDGLPEAAIDGRNTVRFVIGPFDYQWIDVSLDGEGGVRIIAGNSLSIIPGASNHIVVTVPR